MGPKILSVCMYTDPYVREDSASLPAIDAALRHIVQEMLSPIDPSIAEKINWTTSMSPAPFKVSEVFAAIVCIHPCAYMYVCMYVCSRNVIVILLYTDDVLQLTLQI